MTILVTGANGQLGNEMRIVSKNSKDKYVFADVVEASDESSSMLKNLAGEDINTDTLYLDITDIDAIRTVVKENGINVIVNCAAYTNVDAAEGHQELAELLNSKAPESLAIAMNEVNGLLVHISTDYVFGGESYNTPCKEEQKGTPTGIYGLTKLHGEQTIQEVGCNSIIIRTAWLYSEFGKNFVKTMINLTSTKPQLNVVFDQVGTPTYAYDLAEAITVILDDYKRFLNFEPRTEKYVKNGIYHFSNEGVCSWYDFAKMIAEYAGNKECDVQPCHSEEFPSAVERPAFSVLDKTKIKSAFIMRVPYWLDSLKLCIANIV